MTELIKQLNSLTWPGAIALVAITAAGAFITYKLLRWTWVLVHSFLFGQDPPKDWQ